MNTEAPRGRLIRMTRLALTALCLVFAAGCQEDAELGEPPPSTANAVATIASDAQPELSQTPPLGLETRPPPPETSRPAVSTTPVQPPVATATDQRGMTGPASTVELPPSAPSLLPSGMQVTASVTGLSYAIAGAPIFQYELAPPFDAGSAALSAIDPATGEPTSLVPTDQPMWIDFAGFDPYESLELGLYLLIPPKRGGITSVEAGRVATARVDMDIAGALRAVLTMPDCAPAGDYLAVACRDADCTLASDRAAPARVAWDKFHRANPPSPDQPPRPAPTLAQVDSAEGLNVRARPGVASPLRHHLAPNSVVELTGARSIIQDEAWYPVRDPVTCTEGWVKGSFLNLQAVPEAPTPEAEPPVVPTEALTEPEPWAMPLDPVEATPSPAQPVPGFTTGSQARVADSAGATGGLNLRLGPGIRYDALDRLAPGSLVTVLQGPVLRGGSPWYEVRDEATGQQGWVNGDDLLPVSP